MFSADPDLLSESQKFATALLAEKKSAACRELVKFLGKGNVPYHRDVRCILGSGRSPTKPVPTRPPKFTVEEGGFWRDLSPGDFGRDEAGNPVVGRTWVRRVDSSLSTTPEEFMMRLASPTPDGPNPGVIYVVRSPAHLKEVYKIGLTTRALETRMKELSGSTATPLPFEVLHQWEVGDCSEIEKRVHDELADYRVNGSREFFMCPMPHIVATVNEAIEQMTSGYR